MLEDRAAACSGPRHQRALRQVRERYIDTLVMRPGANVVDRFDIDGLAGSGGMGTVWRAHDRLEGGTVALKILTGTRETERSRFLREAVLLSELRHPAIVQYVAHGITPTGELFLAMEWLEGEDLARFLQRQRLGVSDTLGLLRRILEALTVAHTRGVIHRDLKPSNIFLVGGSIDAAKVIDFGVARIPGANTSSHTRTETGTIIGTPGYMPPEQAFGDRDIDARADIFALGCVAFECVSGRPAYLGDTPMGVFRKIPVEEAPRLRDVVAGVPPWLDAVVHRMMARELKDRPRDAASLAAELATAGPAADASADVPLRFRGEARLVTALLVGVSHDNPPDDAERKPGGTVSLEANVGASTRVVDSPELLEPPPCGGNALDAALEAVRCAVALRDGLGGRRIDLLTYRREEREQASSERERSRTSIGPALVVAPSSIVLDEATAELLDLRFHTDRVEDCAILGSERLDSRPIAGKIMPFVGRERELATVESIFAECAEEPVARAVLVTGAAGVGKSRLRRELEKRMGGAGDPGPAIWSVGAWPADAHMPFSVVARLLKRAGGVEEGDSLDAASSKLTARVAQQLGEGDCERVVRGLRRVLQGLSRQGGVTGATVRQGPLDEEIRLAWEDFLAAECGRGPLVLVLEDLHFADPESLRMVDAALHRLRDRPFLVLGLGRPEVHDRFPELWAERGARTLRLGPLPRKACGRLVSEALGDAFAPELAAAIVAKASGNAFFLEELIRAASRGSSESPRTVLAMLESEIVAVPADARRVLRAASLLGATFSRRGAAALLGDAETAAEWLPHLAQRGLVVPVPASGRGDDEEYAFASDLLREAALATMTRADRILGQRLASEWRSDIVVGDTVAD